MTKKHIIIAIDGPSSSGKGSLSRKLANHFGFEYMDTGKLYRALALFLMENNINMHNNPFKPPEELLSLAIKYGLKNYLNSPDINTEKTAKFASIIAAKKEIRSALLSLQRDFANSPKKIGVILDGRDIASVICPNANFKFFITAKLFIRAKRRFKELKKSQKPEMYKNILSKLIYRDFKDTRRHEAPLVPTKDSIYLDTSNLSKEKVFLIATKFILSQ